MDLFAFAQVNGPDDFLFLLKETTREEFDGMVYGMEDLRGIPTYFCKCGEDKFRFFPLPEEGIDIAFFQPVRHLIQ
jgi:hypothetical protein